MALTEQTLRVACSGTMTGNEVWANIWHVITADDAADPVATATMDSIAAEFEAFYTALAPHWANVTVLDQIVITPLAPSTTPPRSYSPTVTGTGGTDIMPGQDAIVLSLRTPLNTKSGRGRIFLAGFQEGITADTSARITSTLRDLIGNEAVALNAALDAIVPAVGIAVYSRLLDDANGVTSFRVGTIIDTQRRRRNAISEQYVSYS